LKYIAGSIITLFFTSCFTNFSRAQLFSKTGKFTHQDTLRGSITPERAWWDVQQYDINVTPDFKTKSITGKTTIRYKVIREKHSDYLQIDLQQPLKIDMLFYDGKMYINYPAKPYYNEGNVWHIPLPQAALNSIHTIGISYHGIPREAINPPWDGGWIFTRDDKGRPWMTVACQGLGASVWYPCKDHQSDEPDQGAIIQVRIPDTLVAVANGRFLSKEFRDDGTALYKWEVENPINNYDIVPYIGKYVNFTDTMNGEKGKLDLSYWVLDYNLEKAKKQFGRDVKRMLQAFEYWFGPYPFYEDGYKLVESSHLGMEHQGATAYGNHYLDGYLGRDLSGSGWGMKWDYIIVHESGHEWFGNNITTNDLADMWVHEGFAMYSEALFIEYYYGKKAADEYVQGIRRTIGNYSPVIGPYGVNQEGSSDMYNKGANLLHTIRQIINDDSIFRKILRGLNKEFYHKTVDSKEVEAYFSKQSGKDLSKIFDQYLRATKIPQLEYKIEGNKLSYRWSNCIAGFEMPVKLEGTGDWLRPVAEWKNVSMTADMKSKGLVVDKNFYVKVKKP
jgi:aminopeptidase N